MPAPPATRLGRPCEARRFATLRHLEFDHAHGCASRRLDGRRCWFASAPSPRVGGLSPHRVRTRHDRRFVDRVSKLSDSAISELRAPAARKSKQPGALDANSAKHGPSPHASGRRAGAAPNIAPARGALRGSIRLGREEPRCRSRLVECTPPIGHALCRQLPCAKSAERFPLHDRRSVRQRRAPQN